MATGYFPPIIARVTDRFDRIMGVFIVLLVLLIGVTVIRGDQIGLGVQDYGPVNSASARANIHIRFNEAVDLNTIQQHFTIQPAVAGKWSISGINGTGSTEAIFHPAQALSTDQRYTVSLGAGLAGADQRTLKAPLNWQFSVRQPSITYLSPASGTVQNVFVTDTTGKQTRQLTHSAKGIASYDISPDGDQLLYSEINEVKDASYFSTILYVMDIATGQSRLLYDCRAMCTDLTWRPDGTMFAYQRAEFNFAAGVGAGAPRVWLFDLNTTTAQPFYTQDQRITFTPRWTPDGTRLAVYQTDASAIVIRDIATAKDISYKADLWQLGTFSPDGKWLYYTRLDLVGQDFATTQHIVLLDLTTDPMTEHDLIPNTTEVSDSEAAWLPDSSALIVAEQPPARVNPRPSTLLRFDLTTGTSTPIVPDEGNTQDTLNTSPIGNGVLFERAPLKNFTKHDLWYFDFKSSTFSRLAPDATSPGWLP